MLGYLLAGFLVETEVSFFPTVQEKEAITIWADIGVIVLLFGLGPEFSFKKLASVGRGASLTALTAILILVLLSTIAVSKTLEGPELIQSSIKLCFFLTLWFLGGIFIVPWFLRKIRAYMNEEPSLIISLGLCLVMVIIAPLGLTLKVTSDFLYPLAVAVSAVTTLTTPYLIRSSDGLSSWHDRAAHKIYWQKHP